MKMMNDQQLKAVSTIDNNVVLSAGAGTGKTTVLTERFLNILENGNLPAERELDSIVAITFTNKAAAEMRQRIYRKLIEKSAADARYLQYVKDFNSVHISTIHSFCKFLIDENILMTDIAPGFEIIDDFEEMRIARNCMRAALGEFAGISEFEFIYELFDTVNIDAMVKDFLTLYRKLRTMAYDFDNLISCFDDLCMQQGDITGQIYELRNKIIELKERLTKRSSLVNKWDDVEYEKLCVDSINLFEAIIFFDLLLPTTDKYKVEVAEIRRLMSEIRLSKLSEDRYALCLIVDILKKADEFYTKFKRENNYLDNDDLQIIARDLLKDKQIARKYGERFKYIMLDEYQDTNAVQKDIFYSICSDKSILDRNNLFVVGDYKQAIYSFRGTEVDLFLETCDDIKNVGGVFIELDKNYRTYDPLLSSINSHFSVLMGEKYGALSAGLGENEDAGIHYISLGDEDALDKNSDAIQACQTANLVKQIISETGAKPSEIAILLRAMTKAKIYEDALLAEGISFENYSGKGFFQSEPVRLVTDILNLVSRRRDSISMLNVLRSKISDIADTDIDVILSNYVFTIDDVSNFTYSDKGAVERFFANISELTSFADANPVYKTVEKIYDLFSLSNIYSMYEKSDINISDVLALRDILRDNTFFNSKNLIEVCDELKYQIDNNVDFEETDFIGENEDAVVISSIHKAKGLEYSYVILPELSSKTSYKSDKFSFNRELGLGFEYSSLAALRTLINEKNSMANEEEMKRVLYVAMTRAKKGLYLLIDENVKLKSTSKSFLKSIKDSADIVCKKLTGAERKEVEKFDIKICNQRPLQCNFAVISASKYAKFMSDKQKYVLSKIFSSYKESFEDTEDENTEEDKPFVHTGVKFGDMVHEYMYNFVEAEINHNSVASAFNIKTVSDKLAVEFETHISFLKSQLDYSHKYVCEMERYVKFKNDYLYGYIDIYDVDNAAIIDYKTNTVGRVEELSANYKNQLDFYRYMLEHSGITVKKQILLFSGFKSTVTFKNYDCVEVEKNLSELIEVEHMTNEELFEKYIAK